MISTSYTYISIINNIQINMGLQIQQFEIKNKQQNILLLKKQLMSASKYITPLRVEADQKQVIIAHLKQQLYHLKKNQQEFYNLQDQYRKLQHKYRLLLQEKDICDNQFKNRHQVALRTLATLKSELDNMKTQLKGKNLQIGDLQVDQNTLRNQLDQRNIQIQKHKAQLKSLLADVDQLAISRRNLLQNADRTRQQNAALSEKVQGMDTQKQGINRKIADTQKYLDELQVQQKILKDKIISYQNQNNNLDNQIDTTLDDINVYQNRINDNLNQIKNYQASIAQVDGLANKYKSQALHCQKATQSQNIKNNQIQKIINQAQNTYRLRIHQIQQGRSQLQNLTTQTQNLNRSNNLGSDDLQFCRKHLQNLAHLNLDLIKHLQCFSEEDQQVRRLIDRKTVIIRMKNRVQQASTFLNRTSITTAITSNALRTRSPLKVYR